jgi:hypothetical protein
MGGMGAGSHGRDGGGMGPNSDRARANLILPPDWSAPETDATFAHKSTGVNTMFVFVRVRYPQTPIVGHAHLSTYADVTKRGRVV